MILQGSSPHSYMPVVLKPSCELNVPLSKCQGLIVSWLWKSFVLWIHYAFINLGECKYIDNVSMAYERKQKKSVLFNTHFVG